MNCDSILAFKDAYLDSELDARTTLEVRQHLLQCPACAATFARAEGFGQRLDAALRHGERSPRIWEAIEQQLEATDPSPAVAPTRPAEPRSVRAANPALSWRYWLWPSPKFYAGLAAAWCLLLGLDAVSRARSTPLRAALASPPVEARPVLVAQRQLRAELLGFPRSQAQSPHSPRSPQSGLRVSSPTPNA